MHDPYELWGLLLVGPLEDRHRWRKVSLTRVFLSVFVFLFRIISAAYGRSRAQGRIGAAAASLHHSHSNTGSKPHLRPTPQLTATPDP